MPDAAQCPFWRYQKKTGQERCDAMESKLPIASALIELRSYCYGDRKYTECTMYKILMHAWDHNPALMERLSDDRRDY